MFAQEPERRAHAHNIEQQREGLQRHDDERCERDGKHIGERAIETGLLTTVELETNGIEFGALTILPGGDLDTRSLEGIDPDLVVKPFGWKGHQATIRGIAEESFRVNLGLVSQADQFDARDIGIDRETYGSGPWWDLDDDGVTVELEEVTWDDGDAMPFFDYVVVNHEGRLDETVLEIESVVAREHLRTPHRRVSL